jgi:hypothetical protein
MHQCVAEEGAQLELGRENEMRSAQERNGFCTLQMDGDDK